MVVTPIEIKEESKKNERASTRVNAGAKMGRLAGAKIYIGDAGRKAPNWGPFLRASGLGRIIHRGVSTGAA